MSTPAFSIIIPVYNVEKYLPQCVDSVLSQTYNDFELILVDDGSNDASPSICDSFVSKDTRVQVLHQKNSGVSVARNNGIDVARGEYITFIDSDDWVEPDYLEQFHIEKRDAELIVQGLEYYDERNSRFFEQVRVGNTLLEERDFKKEVEINNLLHSGYPVAKAYKKELLNTGIRFDPSIFYHEDHIFVLQMLYNSKTIRLVDSIAYKYRYYHSNNTLSSKKHSWINLNRSSESMLSCLNRMKDRFLQADSEYYKKVYTFAYSPKISAIYGLFQTETNYSRRKQNMLNIIKKEDIYSFYYPTNLKHLFIKWVLLHLPYYMSDPIIRIIVKRH